MSFFCFSLLMLALLVVARFRAPMIGQLHVAWFCVSWLPSELPWAFGIFQLAMSVLYLIVGDAFSVNDNLGLLITTVTLWQWYDLHDKTFFAEYALKTALREGLGENYDAELRDDLCVHAPPVIQNGDWKKPFAFRRGGIQRVSNIAYGTHPRQRLDIYHPAHTVTTVTSTKTLRPVLLHVHGGAWVIGNKQQQGQPLMQYLAHNGWICVDINYRLGPKFRFPDCLVDVKTAIAWLKANIEIYGGDPQFIAITGGSAGGHLSSLAALTANQAQFQPGFESSDTRVQAAVPIYGVYDFTNANHVRDAAPLDKFLERKIMPVAFESDPEFWRNASPIFQVREDAPPMFVIHGDNDCLTFVEDTRIFVEKLREKSTAPVLYAEIDGAQHGFEVFHTVRTEFTIEAIGQFLLHCYGKALSEDKAWLEGKV